MSTNDAVIALANGLAGNARIAEAGAGPEVLEAAVTDLFREMTRAMAADGEGATKLLEVVVTGAPSDAAARDVARSIANSPLVKAALFGADPNWGRVLATVGARAGTRGWLIDPYKARVLLQGVAVFAGGAPTDFDRRGAEGPHARAVHRPPGGAGRRGRLGHGLGLRPLLRLREDQRRLLLADRAEGRRRDGPRGPRRQLLARLQARAAGRGAQVHRRLLRAGRGHQVRRRRHGEGVAQGGLRRGRGAAQAGGAQAGGGPRRRARRSPAPWSGWASAPSSWTALRITDADVPAGGGDGAHRAR